MRLPLFNRSVSVTIGIPGQLGFQIKDLKVSFQVKKTESSDPNSCDVSIYNLNEDSRSKIAEKDSILTLNAGYTEDVGEELLFKGNITDVGNITRPPNIISRIEAGDGEKKLAESKMSMSFTEGVTIYQVVKQAIDQLGLPIKNELLLASLKKIKFRQGQAFMGPVKKILDILFADVGFTWSIQNGEIKFYENDKTDQDFAVVLKSDSGLIGSPVKKKIKPATKGSKEEFDGWEVKSLLQPKIEPGGVLEITSREIDKSQFKVVNVSHTGDSIEGEFVTVSEVVAL